MIHRTERSSPSTEAAGVTPHARTRSSTAGLGLVLAGLTHPGMVRPDNQDTWVVVRFTTPGDASPPGNGSGGAVAAGPASEARSGAGLRLQGGNGPDENAADLRILAGRRGTLAMVLDGMGGRAGGRVAAELGASAIPLLMSERWPADPPLGSYFAERLREAVEGANSLIHRRARSARAVRGMATTVTAAAVLGRDLHLVQVGDSRAYLVRGGRPEQLTRDQTVAQEIVDLGHISPEEAGRSPQRHMLVQALGLDATVRPAASRHGLREGDRILLCSDGLPETLKDQEIARTVAEASSPAAACRTLVEQANARGAPDNVTVVLLAVEDTARPG